MIRPPLPKALALLLLLAPACKAPARPVAPSTRGLAPRYLPAFQALGAAVEDQENDLARAIYERLEVRLELEAEAGLEEAEDAQVILDSYGRVLGGRERLAALQLELIGRERPGGEWAINLRCSTLWPTPLELRPGPATINQRVLVLAADGRESWRTETTQVEGLRDWTIEPGIETELPLVELEARPFGKAIAVRRTLVLELRGGEIRDGEEAFPATRPDVATLDFSVPAPYLPTDPVEPAELVRYLEEGERPTLRPADPASVISYEAQRQRFMAALLERAVRIEPTRREEALTLMEGFIARSSVDEIERITPALRWLTNRGAEPELAAEQWKAWFAERGRPQVRTSSSLDLPARLGRD